jgi:hypothetical protein
MAERPDGSVPGAEAILATTYRQVIAFVHERSGRGDLAAHRLTLAIGDPTRPPPPRSLVRQWLANVAAESRVHVDPDIARRLLAALTARERLAAGSADRVWGAVVRERPPR